MQMKLHFAGLSCTLLTAASAKNIAVPDISDLFNSSELGNKMQLMRVLQH